MYQELTAPYNYIPRLHPLLFKLFSFQGGGGGGGTGSKLSTYWRLTSWKWVPVSHTACGLWHGNGHCHTASRRDQCTGAEHYHHCQCLQGHMITITTPINIIHTMYNRRKDLHVICWVPAVAISSTPSLVLLHTAASGPQSVHVRGNRPINSFVHVRVYIKVSTHL